MSTTTDLAEFGYREYSLLIDLLIALRDQGLPLNFYENEVRPMFNKNSGHVFLVNSDYQVAMLNGDKLETWHTCSNCGHEDFKEDCLFVGDGCNECKGGEE